MPERHVPQVSSYATGTKTDPACMCPMDNDLILLRKNAIGERHAIYDYLCAAEKTSGDLCKLFTELAHDEMVHFRRTMTVLAAYDTIQDCAFNDACINLPPLDSFRKSKSSSCFEIMKLLTDAINDELAAINLYQESYTCAEHNDVKILFCDNANDEKIHVAKLWKALMCYTKENTFKA